MKFTSKVAFGGALVMVLAGCAGGKDANRQAKQDFEYLKTSPLADMNLPTGVTLPVVGDFDIPVTGLVGNVGPAVDIRSPVQVLELIPGAQIQHLDDGSIAVWVREQADLDRVWAIIDRVVDAEKVGIRQAGADFVETDWIRWTQEGDEQAGVSSRYVVEKLQNGNRIGFGIKQVDWQKSGFGESASDAQTAQRYTAIMANMITTRFDQQLRDEAQLQAQQQVRRIPISMGTDRSGLPVIIARATYDVFWERAPELLADTGFSVEGRNRSQGEIDARFRGLSDREWAELGLEPVELGTRNYKIQLGDLGNRTSINLSRTDGQPVTEASLKSLAKAFEVIVQR